MIKAIIFDFDGVIVDSEKIWLNTKINTLKKCNIKINKKKKLNSYLGVSSAVFFKDIIFKKKEYVDNIKYIQKTYKELTKKSFKKIPSLNKGLFSILKIKKLNKGIVSNNSKKFIIDCLRHHNILKFFKKNCIVALKGSSFQKPSPFGYVRGLKMLKCMPSEVIVIEDSENGIKAAKRARIKNIFKYNPVILQKKKRNKFVKNINSFSEILKYKSLT